MSEPITDEMREAAWEYLKADRRFEPYKHLQSERLRASHKLILACRSRLKGESVNPEAVVKQVRAEQAAQEEEDMHTDLGHPSRYRCNACGSDFPNADRLGEHWGNQCPNIEAAKQRSKTP